ncbi:unnamed protein product [Absidia cylindrospora]
MTPVYGTSPSSSPGLNNAAKEKAMRMTSGETETQNNTNLDTTQKDSTTAVTTPNGSISSFDSEFVHHRQAVRTRNFDKAIQSFVLLQSNFMDNTIFQDYLIEVASNIHPSKDTELSGFFSALPCLLQSDIVEYVKERSEDLQGFQVMFDYIQAYPRHAYKYMTLAIQILIQTTRIGTHEEKNKYAHLLVADLFPRLCKQRLLLTYSDSQPSVKSTDSKHYIIIPVTLFEAYISTGQQYYIGKRQWDGLTKFTCMMVSSCGYNGFEQLNAVSHTIRFQYLREHRQKVRIDNDLTPQSTATMTGTEKNGRNTPTKDDTVQLMVSATLMCEYMATVSQFVSFGYDYYKSVCGENDTQPSSTLEKTCLIPICALKSSSSTSSSSRGSDSEFGDNLSRTTATLASPNASPARSANTTPVTEGNRKRNIEDSSASPSSNSNEPFQKKMKLETKTGINVDRGQGLSAECMQGVDQALQILSKAADCLRHLVDLWQWATLTSSKHDKMKSWETELDRIIDNYCLPFDTKNAILLLQSDLALSSPSVPGNLAKALELSQTICDRIEVERRKDKSTTLSKADSPELNIPFMFAFRVLYSIAVIYLLVGSIQQSTLEIAIILSVFPIPAELGEQAFITDEVDCNTISTVFQDHEFGLMRVNQVGLVARCIKHLVVSLDSESGQKGGMASIDAAMRWDEKAGNMIVLMQYGWPYWSSRTGMWNKILQRIKEKGTFKNREFLEYIYVEDVLKVIQSIHESKSATLDIIPPEFALRASYRHLVAPHTYSNATATPSPSPSQHGNHDNQHTTNAESVSPAAATRSTENEEEDEDDENNNATEKSSGGMLAPPPTYQPSFANQILPNMSMSPSWYAASTQKNAYTSWMSPSFYYSRPATSVVLPKKRKRPNSKHYQDDHDDEKPRNEHEYEPEDSNGPPSSSPGSSSNLNHHQPEARNRPSDQILTTSTNTLPPFVPRDIVSRCLDYRLRRYSPKVTPQRMRHVLQNFLKNMVLKGSEET